MEIQYKIVSEPDPSDRFVTLLLNGRFNEAALPELAQTIAQARCAHGHVYIDLSEVTLVDRKAVEYFSEQAVNNIKLINCPIYLRNWIPKVSDEVEN